MSEPPPRTKPSFDVSRSPAPVAGCESCRDLAARRAAARTAFDYSAVADANVMMRSHLRLDH
ncbi:hypothetical protein M1L21_35840 [Streptomyces sp. AS02]|nr:hypothetical protein [Streptomyces sp. AS02]